MHVMGPVIGIWSDARDVCDISWLIAFFLIWPDSLFIWTLGVRGWMPAAERGAWVHRSA